MPHSLRREVLKQINMRVLRKVTIFFGCEVTFLRQLCHALQRVTFIPSEEIAVQGDMARELYFIDQGRVQGTMEPPEEDYDSEDMEDWEIEIREREFAAKTVTRVYRDAGTPLCTLSFLFGLRQEESLKAIKKTSCLMLPREEYNAVASEFPADIFKMRKKALDLAKELNGHPNPNPNPNPTLPLPLTLTSRRSSTVTTRRPDSRSRRRSRRSSPRREVPSSTCSSPWLATRRTRCASRSTRLRQPTR